MTEIAPMGLSVGQSRRAYERVFCLASCKRILCFYDQELPFGALRVSTFLSIPAPVRLVPHLLIFASLRCMLSVSYFVSTERAHISIFRENI